MASLDRILLFLAVWSVLSTLFVWMGRSFSAFFRSHPSNKKATIYTSTLFCIALTPLSLFFAPWAQQFPGFESGVSALQRIEERLGLTSLEENRSASSLETSAESSRGSKDREEVSTVLPDSSESFASLDSTNPFVQNSLSPAPNPESPTFLIQVLLLFNRHGFTGFRLLILLCWVSGVVYFSMKWLNSWQRTNRLLKEAAKVECPDILGTVERIRQLLFLNAELIVKQAPYKVSPFVAGFWKPILFLPTQYVVRVKELDFRAVVTHELVHVLRHDLFVHYLMQAIYILLWFLPPVEWLRRELIKNQDCACDEYAAVVLGSGIDYGEALTHYAELCLESELIPIGFAQRNQSLLERLVNITSFPFTRMKKISSGFRLLLGVYVMAAFLLSAMIGQSFGLIVPVRIEPALVNSAPVDPNSESVGPEIVITQPQALPESLLRFSEGEILVPNHPKLLSMAVGDINQDGYPDLALGSDVGQESGLYFSHQGNTFVFASAFGGKRSKISAIGIGDIDLDQDNDLIAGSVFRPHSVLVNDGKGTFTATGTLGQANSMLEKLFINDFNGDGYPDAAVLQRELPQLVYWNNGQGRFDHESPWSAELDLLTAAPWDADADGDVDFLGQKADGKSFVLCRNNAKGEFETSPLTFSLPHANRVFMLPLNAVGLFILEPFQNEIRMAEVQNRSIHSQQTLRVTGNSNLCQSGDMDRDGDLDLVVANVFVNGQVYLNNGQGTFLQNVSFGSGGGSPLALDLQDMDLDGDLDIVLADQQGKVYLYRNLTQPRLLSVVPAAESIAAQPSKWILRFSHPVSPATPDSLTVTGRQSGKHALLLDPDPENKKTYRSVRSFFAGEIVDVLQTRQFHTGLQEPMRSTFQWRHRIAAAPAPVQFDQKTTVFGNMEDRYTHSEMGDLDNDGDLDIVATGHFVPNKIFFNLDRGHAFQPVAFGNGLEQTTDAELGDMDNDGDLDILLANNGEYASCIYYNDGMGSFPDTLSLNRVLYNRKKAALGDIDNDEDLDIALFNSEDGHRLYINQGNRTFQEIMPIGRMKSQVNDVYFADVNADGYLDLLTNSHIAAGNVYYLNDGNGRFSALQYEYAFGEINDLEIGDWDRDSDVDLVATRIILLGNNYHTRIQILNREADGQIVEKQSFQIPGEMAKIQCGDLDGDGDLDLVGFQSRNPILLWLDNDGEGQFAQRELLNSDTPITTGSFSLGDTDGDGDLDLALMNFHSKGIVYFNEAIHDAVAKSSERNSP